MYREAAAPSSSVALDALAPRRFWRLGEDPLEGFLGPRVRVEARGWASLDGARRVRFVEGDVAPRFEELDLARRLTLRSHRLRLRVPAPAIAAPMPRAVWHATVLGRPRRFVCLRGRCARAAAPRLVRLVSDDEGVLVIRVDARGREVGDTWHRRFDDALAQLDHELGPHLGALRLGDRLTPPPREDPWGEPALRAPL